MTELQFQPFPKMARLTRECVITEKIDGTNAQINIVEHDPQDDEAYKQVIAYNKGMTLRMYAGSRTRYITPDADNMGFAAWVKANAEQLFGLGPGRHFGEWWSGKIQRGYGIGTKRFSLFNTSRWARNSQRIFETAETLPTGQSFAPVCCDVVPELYRGLFSEHVVEQMLTRLRVSGSVAAPGFMNPEGIVIYHTHAGTLFKKTIVGDERPKGVAA